MAALGLVIPWPMLGIPEPIAACTDPSVLVNAPLDPNDDVLLFCPFCWALWLIFWRETFFLSGLYLVLSYPGWLLSYMESSTDSDCSSIGKLIFLRYQKLVMESDTIDSSSLWTCLVLSQGKLIFDRTCWLSPLGSWYWYCKNFMCSTPLLAIGIYLIMFYFWISVKI